MEKQLNKIGILRRENKNGDTFRFRLSYHGEKITRTVGYSESEALAVGQEVQRRLIHGVVALEDVTKPYVEQVRLELASNEKQKDSKANPQKEEPARPIKTARAAKVRQRAIRKSKQEEEKRYPARYVPTLDCSKIRTSDGQNIKLIDGYILGLIAFCEANTEEKACFFSVDTIALHANVTANTVKHSISRMIAGGLITQKRRAGKPSLLNIAENQPLAKNALCKSEIARDTKEEPLSRAKTAYDNGLSGAKIAYDKDNGALSGAKIAHDNDLCGAEFAHDKNNGRQNLPMTMAYGRQNLPNITPVVSNIYKYNNIYKQQQQDKMTVDVDEQSSNNPLVNFELGKCADLWEKGTGAKATAFQREKLANLLSLYSYELVYHALTLAFEQNAKAPLAYILPILKSWQDSGLSQPWEHSSRQVSKPMTIQAANEETEQARAERLAREQEMLDKLTGFVA